MIVLDSSFLVALHNASDVHHARAAGTMAEIDAGRHGRALLLEYVLVEVATVVLMRRDLTTALRVCDALLQAEDVDFVAGAEVLDDALAVFRHQSGGRLSLVDAAIVAVARSRADGLVATFDRALAAVEGIAALPA